MTRKVRVELPVLLYVDVEIEDLAANTPPENAAKARVWRWIGQPGAEEGVDLPAPSYLGLSAGRIYPSDHAWCDSSGKFSVADEDLDVSTG